MTQDNLSHPSGICCIRRVRRRSLSEGCDLNLLAAITDGESLYTEPENSFDHLSIPSRQHENKVLPMVAHRSKSESTFCTAQGITFQDKSQKYQTRLKSLIALAANPCSSQSNVMLARKALRYRSKTGASTC
ncbi:unnamed protein product [Peronospora effusa]|nr:unnamed protein product [Peronospora effusa]